MSRPVPTHVVVVLGVAVLAISSAGVLVRGLPDVHPVSIAMWRTAGASLLLAPALRRVSPRDVGAIAAAGFFLAIHFASWFASIHHTTILRSTVLVCSSPIWVGLLEWAFLRRPPTSRYWLGLGVALAGVTTMGLGGDLGGGSLLGDGLAILGGFCAALYLVIGRSVRARVGIGSYACLVCLFAALTLAPGAWLLDAPVFGWDLRAWLLIAALTAGPQLLGHNGFNYALKYVPAATVSAVTLLEPVGATVLAALFYGEWPTILELLGGGVLVGGVAVALHRPADPTSQT